jgi:hypothetical protein
MDSRKSRTEAGSPVVRDAALRVRHDAGRDRRRDGFERDASASQAWDGWRSAVIIVKPETVITWHRRGFRLFWRWKSRGRNGRPGVPPDVRALIRELSTANPLWGAPRIHGELQKLGVSASQSTVAKYMRRHPRPPSQTWRTFLTNHASQIMAVDLFVVPTVTFRMVSFAKLGSGGHLECAAVMKPLRHTATCPEQP